MSRLRNRLESNRMAGVPSLGLFVTNGYPVGSDTLSILNAVSEGGADFIELGMPFSDPLAEGATIQRSSEGALSAGVTMEKTFEIAAAFRQNHTVPLVLMGYVNPVMRYGISNFFKSARSSGVDALILPDLPPEEADLFRDQARSAGIDLVFLIAPTTPDERVQKIDNLSDGFVYAVSVTGLTGSHLTHAEAIFPYLDRVRSLVTRNPLLVGFGISTHEDIVGLSGHSDGCIVGSALIRELERLWNDPNSSASERLSGVRTFVSDLKHGPYTD